MSPLDDLLAAFDVAPLGPDRFAARTPRGFPGTRLAAGQAVGQALVAAARTVGPGPTGAPRPPHSLHAHLLRLGDPHDPLQLSVRPLHDGRSYATRMVEVHQDGHLVAVVTAGFHLAEAGPDLHEAPPDLPGPQAAVPLRHLLEEGVAPEHRYWADQGIEIRALRDRYHGGPDDEYAVWWRADGPVPDDPAVHAALLVYALDVTAFEQVAFANGLYPLAGNALAASLDHAVWWHRPVQADAWHLAVPMPPTVAGGRGLSGYRVFDSGRLVATFAQEGMLRPVRT